MITITGPFGLSANKEVSTNYCCKFMAIFIVFPDFGLKQLQQLFSDNSWCDWHVRKFTNDGRERNVAERDVRQENRP